MPFNVRMVLAQDSMDMIRELANIGVSSAGCTYMDAKGLFRLLRADGISIPAALILKQEMLSIGGEAALHQQTIVHGIDTTSVLMMATLSQYTRLNEKLRGQQFGLPKLAEEIEEVLRNITVNSHCVICKKKPLILGARTYVMGIVNVTPDSFSDGGHYIEPQVAIEHALALAEAGADIIDIGGASSRPGFVEVSSEEEIERIIPVIEGLAPLLDIPISIDSDKAKVARAALASGADIINDIWGLQKDPQMALLAAATGAPVIAMHNQDGNYYNDLIGDMMLFFRRSLQIGEEAGMSREQFILDPGIGFGKTAKQNLEVLRNLEVFCGLGLPLLVGTSRKTFIGKILDKPVEQRLEGTAVTVALSIAKGADIVRVHDVEQMSLVARMTDAVLGKRKNG